MLTLAEEFLEELAAGAEREERVITCGFPGDPDTADPTAWRPRAWRPGTELPYGPRDNAYATVGLFRRAPDGTYRRRAETFAAGCALMVDDVGTKVDRKVVEHMRPTWRIETSAGNEQWWYLLAEPERDAARFDGLIRAFIAGRLLGADPGMSGVTRVGRLPGHLNGKARHAGWTTRALDRGGPRWTPEQLLEGFELQIVGRRVVREKLPTAAALERNEAYAATYTWLDQRNMLKRHEPDLSGWTEMRCPWAGDHTGGVDTGAALREPAAENDWYGAFRCHHGHCAHRGWRHLTEWVAEESAEELARATERAAEMFEEMQNAEGV
jgi:hypothetical protein